MTIKKTYIFIIFLFIFTNFSFSQQRSTAGSQKIDNLLQLINYAYVDSTNENKLVETAIVALLKDLDPHSVYIPRDELEKMNEPLVGNFEGIGIQFNIHHDTLIVVSPIPSGPSEKVGIQAGDKIIEVDKKNIAGIGLQNSDVQNKLRGKKGTKVEIGIKRKGEKELLNFTIIRDKIPIFSVDASYMLDNETGYIKINRFAEKTIDEFREGLAALKKQNVKNLIVDLRGNGGGYLKTAIQLADEFLDQNKRIVYTKGLNSPQQDYYTTEKGGFETGKLVVLIDEGSASASEIVSGAIQDYDRGLIIGRRSFGKGLVQKPFSLIDGSAVRLTVSRYYTPSGRSIQRPYDDGKEAYYKEFSRRYEHGEFSTQDSIFFPDSLKFSTLISKRTVYGGGGIMPDVFIPIDTSMASEYFSKVLRKGLINEFSLDYTQLNREELFSKYNSVINFKTNFNAETELLESFIAYAEKNEVERNDEQIAISKDFMLARIKAVIARNLWDNSAYYQVISDIDDAVQIALKEINGSTFKKEKIVYK
jgi:carboxyl-terminal processing protease